MYTDTLAAATQRYLCVRITGTCSRNQPCIRATLSSTPTIPPKRRREVRRARRKANKQRRKRDQARDQPVLSIDQGRHERCERGSRGCNKRKDPPRCCENHSMSTSTSKSVCSTVGQFERVTEAQGVYERKSWAESCQRHSLSVLGSPPPLGRWQPCPSRGQSVQHRLLRRLTVFKRGQMVRGAKPRVHHWREALPRGCKTRRNREIRTTCPVL